MIRLEPFENSDFSRLINWVQTEEEMIIFSADLFTFPITNNQLSHYLNASNRIIYKVLNVETGEIIGHAELNNINFKSKNSRICRVLIGDKKYRNHGFGTHIINELIKIAFNKLKLHRLDLGVYDFNLQAIKCYKNCGFEIEGLLKENVKFEDAYWSTYNMSILNKNHL
ncbi:MAG: GNAT family protein [Polaribacter sp.]|uniref:GNAT family N-acetyltransferase n=1 Tax=Polaribacter sp. TaxID=1920175 RepID=UPI003BAF8BC2